MTGSGGATGTHAKPSSAQGAVHRAPGVEAPRGDGPRVGNASRPAILPRSAITQLNPTLRWAAVGFATLVWAVMCWLLAAELPSTRSAVSVVAALVGAVYVGTGAMLLRSIRGRNSGWFILASGAIWPGCLGTTGTGWLPLLGFTMNTLAWTLLIPAVLCYPGDVTRGRGMRIFLAAQAVSLVGFGVVQATTSLPEWNGVSAQAEWPTIVPNRLIFDLLSVPYILTCLGLAVGTLVFLRRRVRTASVLDQKTLLPAVVGAGVAGLTAAVVSTAMTLLPNPDMWAVGITVQGLALLAVPASAVSVEFKLRRIATDVVAALPAGATPQQVEQALAAGLRDPSVAVFFPVGASIALFARPELMQPSITSDGTPYVDSRGRRADPFSVGEHRVLAAVEGFEPDAPIYLSLDRAVQWHREQVDVALSAAGLALINATLQAELRARILDVADSRVRIVDAQRDERERIASDLHDSLQQSLLGIAARSGALRDKLGDDAVGAEAAALATSALHAVERVRQVSRGLHSPLLRQRGLEAALEEVTDGLPIPVDLEVQDEELPERVRDIAYLFSCEALANVVKHSGARLARVEVRLEGRDVVVAVHDDGVGGVPTSDLALRSLRRRASMGDGLLTIVSPPGGGTVVSVRLPGAAQPS